MRMVSKRWTTSEMSAPPFTGASYPCNNNNMQHHRHALKTPPWHQTTRITSHPRAVTALAHRFTSVLLVLVLDSEHMTQSTRLQLQLLLFCSSSSGTRRSRVGSKDTREASKDAPTRGRRDLSKHPKAGKIEPQFRNESQNGDTQEDHSLFGHHIIYTQHFVEVPGPLPHER
jgi:hypothetical protein